MSICSEHCPTSTDVMTHSKPQTCAIQCALLGIAHTVCLAPPAGHTKQIQPINFPKALNVPILPRSGKVNEQFLSVNAISDHLL